MTAHHDPAPAAAPRKAASPDLQRAIEAFSGTWAITEQYPPGANFPKGGSGKGSEDWRSATDGLGLIYEYRSVNPNGEIRAMAVLWWDTSKKALQELWCVNGDPSGCVLSAARIYWEGSDLVFIETYETRGHRMYSREVWSDIKPSSHTMTISEGEVPNDLHPWIISRATRVK